MSDKIDNGDAELNSFPTIRKGQTPEQSVEGKAPKVKQVAVDKLVPFKYHPFQTYEGERLEKLADSIGAIGLQNPIIVRLTVDGNYEILSGHNRVEAVKLLGWEKIPAIVRDGLSDEEAERIVIESNLNQQSFSDWKYSQQIRVIKMYSRYIQENSQQGKRNDLADDATCVHGEHKSEDRSTSNPEPKRPKTRDKISKQLGISSTVFERYRSIAKLDEDTVNILGSMLDEKRLGFMSAYRLSQLRAGELTTALGFLKADPEIKLRGANVKSLYDASKGSENDLTADTIREMLLSEDTVS